MRGILEQELLLCALDVQPDADPVMMRKWVRLTMEQKQIDFGDTW